MKINLTPFLLIALLVLAALLYFTQCNKTKEIQKDNTALVNALADSIKILRLKDSSSQATITILTTDKAKTFLQLQTKDKEVTKLQGLVKQYESKLEEGSSVTNSLIETVLNQKTPTTIIKRDTIRKDSIVYLLPTYATTVDSTVNKWIPYSIIANNDSIKLKIKVHNEFDAVVGYDKKEKKPFTTIRLYNPYSEVTELRTYQVSMPLPSSWGLGIIGGYGLGNNLQTGGFIGIGLYKNLLRF